MTRSALGSVRKLDEGRWKVIVELPPDSKSGKRRQRTKNVRGSRKEAYKILNEMLLNAGHAPSAKLTCGEFWESYIKSCEERLRENTCHGYDSKWRTLCKDDWENTALEDVTPARIESWLARIDGEARKFEAFKLMRQMFNRAIRLDLVSSNPFNRVEVPKKRRHRPQVLNAEEAAAYVEHFRGTRLEAFILLAIGCGLRRSENCALNWADVKDGFVIIDNAITQVSSELYDNDPKTEFSTRRVAVPPAIWERLEALRTFDDVPITLDAWGKRMTPDRISRVYEEIRDTLPEELPRVPLRDLRHTSLTLALEGGADLLAVSRRAGHSSPSVTSRFYLRPHESIDVAAAAGLDAVLGLCPDVSKPSGK